MKPFRPAIAPFAPRSGAWRVTVTRAARGGARWPALRLQWRRNARAQGVPATAGARLLSAPSWAAAIGLHVSVLHQVTNMFPARTQALPGAPPPTRLDMSRAAHGAPRHAAAATPAMPAPRARALRALAPSALVWRAWRGTAPAAPAGAAPRGAHALLAAPGGARMALAGRAPAPQLAWKATPSPLRHAALRAATSHRSPEAPCAAALRHARAPTLVWRKAAAAPRAQEGQARAAGAPMLLASAADSARAAPAVAAPGAALPAPVRQQLQATSLAPALAERLADEVIRRVERSMRIERERRGR
ncbi:hypothetical protein [Massilia genomosp. 1]|uniref:Uncharacterized protein n=1 Tax=Massilia genomosp. 1 TaxID=2609280 RepID=A0ABX0MX22_9BURK|nr:hypothetical protein [Massilia genomosp. 1]NHZ64608.1 hypothetical protein [Massilia genomosp. 1]